MEELGMLYLLEIKTGVWWRPIMFQTMVVSYWLSDVVVVKDTLLALSSVSLFLSQLSRLGVEEEMTRLGIQQDRDDKAFKGPKLE